MRNILLIGLYVVLSLKEVFGESENDVKRGIHPFMAVIYYPDATIVGPSGARFTRNAILFRSDWLISSSLETNETQLAFPQKTLIARAGAIAIDSNFTFNEDEGEQEREIIRIVRPTNFTVSQWWINDITLLKVLTPFIVTPKVALATLSEKQDYMDKTCFVLVFAKKTTNSTDDKLLMQLTVELLPPSNENCGVYFRNDTMICASGSEENKKIEYDPDFCYSNGGGPLMCERDVIGLQTYIADNCRQPYLYQSLSAWDDFITCGFEDKCRMQQCAKICGTIDKDEVIAFGANEIMTITSSESAKTILIERATEDINEEETSLLPDTTSAKMKMFIENESPTPTTSSTTEVTTAKETTPPTTTENEEKTTTFMEEEAVWPKQKYIGHRKQLDEAETNENIERSTSVEAQRHEVKKKGRSAAENHIYGKMGMIYSLFFGLLFFICVI